MDSFSSNLQVPEPAQAGPSRQIPRPVSVQPTSTSAAVSSSSGRKRASHTVVTSQPQPEEQPVYRDIYSHPAAVEYLAAHPKRTIPKFGPYLLLQTLGEGEFGKVKLGLHMQWGEEVAVKLIRRGNIDSSVRMSKVEREIEVLRTLKHPNIVRLYDVIETEKYIGIILEYASGGELFDHILAHRYLREKDACKLFSQLISGVWYIHQKKIVHRDLKLENLLLDRHRNVIITDFGFANRFEHRADDLMQTSCGSPCYAAPELVISDGLYVGSAVDIWSCGVILYAMLAGYLPFDDDPANPDGDNINLLYKYIVNTPLSFPEYVSVDARDLLSIMLVPDPAHRADLPTVMAHKWLVPYAHLFSKNVAEMERAAMEQHHQKRLAYQRQMKQSAQESSTSKINRSHSARTETYASTVTATAPSRSRSSKDQGYNHHAQPEYLYETSADQAVYSTSAPPSASRRVYNSAIVLPSSTPMVEDDPFAPSSLHDVSVPSMPSQKDRVNGMHNKGKADGDASQTLDGVHTIAPSKSQPDTKRAKGGFRHTIQVEYGESESQPQPHRATSKAIDAMDVDVVPVAGPPTPTMERERPSRKESGDEAHTVEKSQPVIPAPSSHRRSDTITSISRFPAPTPATAAAPVVSIEVTGPPVSPIVSTEEKAPSASEKTDTTSSKQSRHRRGLSIDKIGITKIFGSTTEQSNDTASRASSQNKKPNAIRTSSSDAIATSAKSDTGGRPSTFQVPLSSSPVATDSTAPSALLSPDNSVKKARRNTLTVVAEPWNRIKQRSKGNKQAIEAPMQEKPLVYDEKKAAAAEALSSPIVPPKSPVVPPKLSPIHNVLPSATPQLPETPESDLRMPLFKGHRTAVPASTVKASRVMQWFRSKSKTRAGSTDDEAEKSTAEIETVKRGQTPSTGTVNGTSGRLATPVDARVPFQGAHGGRSASSNAEPASGNSLAERVRNIGGGARRTNRAYPDIRTHHGAVDQTTVTTAPPPEVMQHVRKVLEGMGVDIHVESEYKYRCVRPKKAKSRNGVGLGLRDGSGSGLAVFTMVGSAASNGVDKRGLPQPSQTHTSFSSGSMLRGLLMRRQSSQVSTSSLNHGHNLHTLDGETSPDAIIAAAVPGRPSADSPIATESVYGDSQQDQGDEIRFSVELTRMDRLNDTYSLDIRRLKGNLRSYKFVYDTLRQRADLQRVA
ncbi:Pkinase-domain-containing protein [Laetiporus sulphureus 93-53]|uniref:non-specific serine/threonine protein kinase n=1 Tax=Laetiporus sulphureus 93-53 TaxID=1314785 RepID=A0A165B6Q3_9APHY|nr:Pkinase-domain-containing protein [Laetiporus sulphureus 93-53]KZT00366.1 Pkinase-domain-containing protein [Laetiporus sulphureus 93-53]